MSVSLEKTSHSVSETANDSGAISNPMPKGIASNPSSIQSAETQQPASHVEYTCAYFQTKLALLGLLEGKDDLIEKLALKEADENPVVYTLYGQHVYKRSWNILWKIWTSIPVVGNKTYYEIGAEEAQKKPKDLIPYLKQYYQMKIEELENKIKTE